MVDVFNSAKRSDVMAKIRGRGNRSTELAMVSAFRSARVTGWRRHVAFVFRVRAPEGSATATAAKPQVVRVRPDFIFRTARLAVFVDGCFWHCCPLHSRIPENNRSFWELKLEANTARDRQATRLFREAGWSVLRVWEHELRDVETVVKRIERRLQTRRLRLPAARRRKELSAALTLSPSLRDDRSK